MSFYVLSCSLLLSWGDLASLLVPGEEWEYSLSKWAAPSWLTINKTTPSQVLCKCLFYYMPLRWDFVVIYKALDNQYILSLPLFACLFLMLLHKEVVTFPLQPLGISRKIWVSRSQVSLKKSSFFISLSFFTYQCPALPKDGMLLMHFLFLQYVMKMSLKGFWLFKYAHVFL